MRKGALKGLGWQWIVSAQPVTPSPGMATAAAQGVVDTELTEDFGSKFRLMGCYG